MSLGKDENNLVGTVWMELAERVSCLRERDTPNHSPDTPWIKLLHKHIHPHHSSSLFTLYHHNNHPWDLYATANQLESIVVKAVGRQ
jgi:hypothetical protein